MMAGAALGILCVAATAMAQTTDGSLAGLARDSVSGQPVAGAAILAERSDTGVRTLARSGSDGRFTIPRMAPGRYRVQVHADNYQLVEIQNLDLAVAGVLELDLRLRPSSDVWERGQYRSVFLPGSKKLTVFYGPDLDTSYSTTFEPQEVNAGRLDTSLSDVVSREQIQDLPLTGRDAYNSLVLEPGVDADTTTARGIGVSVNGQRPSASNFLLDGVENNNYLISGPMTVLAPEAVEEYRVSTAGYSAEYGRTAGYVANVVTRAGTNQWHGVGYLVFENDWLNATDFSANANGYPHAPFRYWEPGFQAGGPILRSRLYFSSALDHASTYTTGNPESFYLPSSQFMTQLAAAPQLFGADAQQLLLSHPPPAISSPAGAAVAMLTVAPPLPVDQTVLLERADYVARGGEDRLTARLAASRVSHPDFVWSPYSGFSSTFRQNATSGALGYVSVLTPSLTNEAHAAISSDLIGFNRPDPQIPTVAAQPDNAAGFVFLPGSPAAYGYNNSGNHLELLDNLAWIRGRHQFKFGGGLLSRWIATNLSFATAGEFSFPNFTNFTADLFSSVVPDSVLAGVSRQALASGALAIPDTARQYRETQFDLFAEDSFRITPRLSVNYGIRYENFGAPENVGAAKDATVELGAGSGLAQRLAGASVIFPQSGNQKVYSANNANWGPRLGLAYSPFHGDRTVLRAGYGIFYDGTFDNLWENVANNNIEVAAFSPNGVVPYLEPLSQVVASLPGLNIQQSLSMLTLFQPGLRTPYVQSFFLGVQNQAAHGLTIEVNGAGSLSRQLLDTDIVNRNFSVPGIDSAIASRLQPSLAEIYYLGNQGDSDYLGMTAQARYRHGATLFQAAYTWSHSIDNQSEPLAGEYFNFQFFAVSTPTVPQPISAFSQQFDSAGDRGNSDFDQRQALTFSAIREFNGGNRFLRGWRIAGVGALRSGLPFTVFGTSPNGTAILNDRPSLVSNSYNENLPAPGGKLVLNSSAFSMPAGDQVGNLGRNAFTGPGFYNIDLSLARTFPLKALGDAGAVTIRADAFNFLNHANLGNPNSFLGSPDFGVATYGRQEVSTGAPDVFPLRETARQIQLQLKIRF
jgi:Carboxypeptidase regulatory-like domain/TonB-dependent Receptor Plug Domain